MSRRVFLTVVAATVLAVVLFGVPLAVVAGRRINDDAIIELQRIADDTVAGLPATIDGHDPIELPRVESSTRIAVYGPSGLRVAGDGPATADALVASTADGTVHSGVIAGERIVAVPVRGNESVGGTVRVAEQRDEVRRRELATWATMAGVGALAVALAAGAGMLVGRRLTQPVRRLRDASVRLGQGDFTVTARRSGIIEVDEAADALGATARRLGTMLERERTFASDASHQLRTPVASLRLALENELADPRADPSLALTDALSDVDRLDETITDLLALARDIPDDRPSVPVDELVRTAETRWHGPLAAHGRPLRVSVDPSITPVAISRVAVSTVLDVLVDNALRHGAGTVTITAHGARPTGVIVMVSDEGRISLPDDALFRRRDPLARDHGIGLALARSLAEAEGVHLLLRSRQPTTFELVLPSAHTS